MICDSHRVWQICARLLTELAATRWDHTQTAVMEELILREGEYTAVACCWCRLRAVQGVHDARARSDEPSCRAALESAGAKRHPMHPFQ